MLNPHASGFYRQLRSFPYYPNAPLALWVSRGILWSCTTLCYSPLHKLLLDRIWHKSCTTVWDGIPNIGNKLFGQAVTVSVVCSEQDTQKGIGSTRPQSLGDTCFSILLAGVLGNPCSAFRMVVWLLPNFLQEVWKSLLYFCTYITSLGNFLNIFYCVRIVALSSEVSQSRDSRKTE